MEFYRWEERGWIKICIHTHTHTHTQTVEWLNSQKRDDFTRVKVKLSVVARSCVKTKVALLASHDPDELVRLGVRFVIS